MMWLFEDTYYELDDEPYQRWANGLEDRGVVFVVGRPDALMKCVISLMGLEYFTYSLSDYPKETETLIEKVGNDNDEAHKTIVQSNAEVIGAFGDTTTLLVSPAMYERYGMPAQRKDAEICHASGKILMKHSCGHLRGLLPAILKAGYDAHHYLASPPIGDTPLKEARELWKDNITIMAAIDPLTQANGTPDEVRENVVAVLKDAAPGRSFMLMSSSKPDVPEANIRMIGETMKEFGKYPLTL